MPDVPSGGWRLICLAAGIGLLLLGCANAPSPAERRTVTDPRGFCRDLIAAIVHNDVAGARQLMLNSATDPGPETQARISGTVDLVAGTVRVHLGGGTPTERESFDAPNADGFASVLELWRAPGSKQVAIICAITPRPDGKSQLSFSAQVSLDAARQELDQLYRSYRSKPGESKA